MPTNKKKKNRVPKQPPHILPLLPTVCPDPDNYYHEPMQYRTVPNAIPDLVKIRIGVEKCRNGGTATMQRFARAYELLKAAERVASRCTEMYGEEASMGELLAENKYVEMCANLIRGMVLTDFRGTITAETVASTLPSCWASITELHPLLDKDCPAQLANIRADAFIVLLATAIRLFFAGSSDVAVLQICSELHKHATNGWIDWSTLTTDHDEASLRFALACMGIKVARRLYRARDSRQPFPHSPKLTSTFLLDFMEILARDQCNFSPESALGYWNMGYIAQQSVAKRGVHGLEGAAECLAYMQKCIQVADEQDDDFLKANARIEAATCLVLGASGIVGFEIMGEKGQAQRDMRSAASRGARSLGGNADFVPFHCNAFAYTNAARMAIVAKEKRRFEQGIPATQLDPGETLLIPRWEVLQLWNEAMQGPYDSLCRMNHECFVYGEVAGWNVVAEFLQRTSHYEKGQYAVAPENPGFVAERDKGFEYTQSISCAACGKADKKNKKCSRCKTVVYCSRECQVAHWKAHKPCCKTK